MMIKAREMMRISWHKETDV